nr:50S ribosomal protein L9 [bacterium]
MKVVLIKDVQGTGKKDQVVEVSDGYARNYLLPRKLAREATAQAIGQIQQQKAAEAHRKQVEQEQARQTAKELSGITVAVPVRAGKDGRLFGSVTSAEIAQALAQQGYEVDKKKIVLPDGLRQLGEAEVEVRLFTGISAKLKVNIVAMPV